MIEDDFYATIKLKTGEEIFAKVAASEEEEKTFLLVSNPITITEVRSKNGIAGYKVEPWLKTSTEDMFIVDIDNVLTMSECYDNEMIEIFQSYVNKTENLNSNEKKLNRKMGYLADVNEAKRSLENIFKNS